jgi:hypothetical protein
VPGENFKTAPQSLQLSSLLISWLLSIIWSSIVRKIIPGFIFFYVPYVSMWFYFSPHRNIENIEQCLISTRGHLSDYRQMPPCLTVPVAVAVAAEPR